MKKKKKSWNNNNTIKKEQHCCVLCAIKGRLCSWIYCACFTPFWLQSRVFVRHRSQSHGGSGEFFFSFSFCASLTNEEENGARELFASEFDVDGCVGLVVYKGFVLVIVLAVRFWQFLKDLKLLLLLNCETLCVFALTTCQREAVAATGNTLSLTISRCVLRGLCSL